LVKNGSRFIFIPTRNSSPKRIFDGAKTSIPTVSFSKALSSSFLKLLACPPRKLLASMKPDAAVALLCINFLLFIFFTRVYPKYIHQIYPEPDNNQTIASFLFQMRDRLIQSGL